MPAKLSLSDRSRTVTTAVPWTLTESYDDSAERLYLAALVLSGAGDVATAGHLYGVAAECGIKGALERAGILIDRRSGFKVHIPELINSVLLSGQTRHMISILGTLASVASLSTDYKIDTRYAAETCIGSMPSSSWQSEAEQVLIQCGFHP